MAKRKGRWTLRALPHCEILHPDCFPLEATIFPLHPPLCILLAVGSLAPISLAPDTATFTVSISGLHLPTASQTKLSKDASDDLNRWRADKAIRSRYICSRRMEVEFQSLHPVEAFRSSWLHKTALLDHRAARSNTAQLTGLKYVSLEYSHFELIPPPDLWQYQTWQLLRFPNRTAMFGAWLSHRSLW